MLSRELYDVICRVSSLGACCRSSLQKPTELSLGSHPGITSPLSPATVPLILSQSCVSLPPLTSCRCPSFSPDSTSFKRCLALGRQQLQASACNRPCPAAGSHEPRPPPRAPPLQPSPAHSTSALLQGHTEHGLPRERLPCAPVCLWAGDGGRGSQRAGAAERAAVTCSRRGGENLAWVARLSVQPAKPLCQRVAAHWPHGCPAVTAAGHAGHRWAAAMTQRWRGWCAWGNHSPCTPLAGEQAQAFSCCSCSMCPCCKISKQCPAL